MVESSISEIAFLLVSTTCEWCKPVSLFTLCLSVLTEEFRGSVFERLPEAVYKRRRAGWRRETGNKHVTLHIFINEVHNTAHFSSISTPSSHPSPLFLNVRRATNAKPGESVPKGSASKSSLRSSCFVSFLGVAVLVCLCSRRGCSHVLLANTQEKQRLWFIRSCLAGSFPAHWEINVCTVQCNYR